MENFPSNGRKLKKKKKKNKQLNENYRLILFLFICGKILERLNYNKMFVFFTDNKLISSNQSCFKPGDSCINKLLYITHDVYQSFDDDPEAFDKV